MDRKVCFKCKIGKALEEFYVHSMMADGHLNKCKECTKRDVREHRRTHPSVQEYDRWRFQHDPVRRADTRRRANARRKANPLQGRASCMVSRAVRDGRLARPSRCSRCGEKGRRIEAHHPDYTKPLEVIWVCSLCHRRHFS